MSELLIASIASFLVTLVITPYAIRYFKFVNVTSTDLHKKGKPLIPSSAGIPIAVGFILSMLLFIFMDVFLQNFSASLVILFAALTSILLIVFSGFFDDLNSVQVRRGNYTEGKRGLKNWQKPLLTIPAALPLMAIMAGDTGMVLPLIGAIDFGFLFPLLIIPVGVVVASNMVNMLGGFNGIEIGMGLVYTLALGLFAAINGSVEASVIFFMTFASLLGMVKYNFSPAKILSGDSTTYMLGAVIAVGAFVGNIEKAALIISIPFIIQAALKFYSRYKLGHFASDTGVLQKDGTIKSRYGKSIYSWTHIMMRMRHPTERKITLGMMAVQAIFCVIPFLNVL
jgi:UDP-N-acetylglucosamine--dolichyl-phosphate N-acetylglucosaminephosphotransferase